MTRVLVIRFSSMGDIILSAPVIPLLLNSIPDIQIDYLVHERFSTLVRHFDPPPHDVIAFPPHIRAAQLPKFARDLGTQNYDLVIDLHNSPRSRIVRWLLRPAELRVYRKPRLKRLLLFYLWINRFKADFSVVNEYLHYAGLNPGSESAVPHMAVNPEHARDVSNKLEWNRGM